MTRATSRPAAAGAGDRPSWARRRVALATAGPRRAAARTAVAVPLCEEAER
jgi:hypothetical protein